MYQIVHSRGVSCFVSIGVVQSFYMLLGLQCFLTFSSSAMIIKKHYRMFGSKPPTPANLAKSCTSRLPHQLMLYKKDKTHVNHRLMINHNFKTPFQKACSAWIFTIAILSCERDSVPLSKPIAILTAKNFSPILSSAQNFDNN